MRFRTPGHVLLIGVACLFFLPIALAQQPVSHARVVRLSYLSGTVAVKRPGATEWSKALVNTPVQEGFEISTDTDSFAEVEFENGSSARLGQLSHLAFNQLALDAEGHTLNRMTFEQGYATFHFLPEKHDSYSVKIADATLTPSGKSSVFRTDFDRGRLRIEVFNGSLDVAAPSGSAKLGKDKVLEYTTGATELALNNKDRVVKDDWDKWTAARDTQASLALNDQAVAARGPVYGWSDLDTYGEWAMIPGFGYGWSPFAPMGWSPYSMGMWGMYPGMGYTWISGEPWGWLPYHYGMWNYSPAFGYFWMPGSFGAWSPALVSWYAGPGWVGWSPLGLTSQVGPIRPVNTMSGSTIRTEQLITPETVGRAEISQGLLMAHPPASALLTATALRTGTGMPFSGQAAGTHPAPATILMGGEANKETALLGGRTLRQPLRVQMGNTLGGRYAVGGAVGEFRGDTFKGMAGAGGRNAPAFGNSAPRVLPHGQAASANAGGAMMRGGGVASPGPVGMGAPSSSHGESSSSSGHH